MDRIIILTGLLCISNIYSAWTLQCLDKDGLPVDWYSSYKAPKLRHISSLFEGGVAHYYLDVNFPSWNLSKYGINDKQTAIYNTLQQVYSLKDKQQNVSYIMYNDEHPDGTTHASRGHSKGVMAFDGKSGFWLIHSVPKFPPVKADMFSYPSSGKRFGQSFLCVSLPYSMLGSVGQQLLYNEALIFDELYQPFMMSQFPVLNDLKNRKNPLGPPWYSVLPIQTVKGQNFTSFAKSPKFNREIYTDLVAPVLKQSLVVETWMDGGGQLATNCSMKYKVYNAKVINFSNDVVFKRSKDHSKWATGFKDKQDIDGFWTCIGDINRMFSQYKRGGGTLCLQNKNVWQSFRHVVEKFEKCNRDLA